MTTTECTDTNINTHIPFNASRSNEFLIYFLKIPQTGNRSYSKFLKPNYLDLLNRSVKEFSTPSFNISEILIKNGGRLASKFTGDTFEISNFSITFKIDADYLNYNTFLNWALINIDPFGIGVKNTNFTQNDCVGEVIINFIDVGMTSKHKLLLSVKPVSIPEITFTTDNNEDLLLTIEFSVEDANIKELSDYV